jgi:type VI secretion system protein ImpJ
MKYLSRVVWSEGMYLGPHHFQAQSRYFEDSIRFTTSSLWFEAWGLVGGQMDAEALQNGTVSIVHSRGIFPDGLAFHMPECDDLPEPRSVGDHFPPTRDTVAVLLVVPPRRPEGLNCILNDAQNGAPARFKAEPRMLYDETTGRDEKPVQLGSKNIRLMFETEWTDSSDLLALPVARITRDTKGHYIYDPAFVPPCVEISASDRLMTMLKRLLEILGDKSAMFSRGKAGDKRTWAEFSTREIANFWLLHTVNSALAPLRHHYVTKRGHPEELYREMLRLGGALCTFAFESHPRDLPIYDHKRLDDCFGRLDEHIRRHLETIVPTQYISIPLVKRADYFYEGEITDQRALDKAKWIFGISAKMGEADLIANTGKLVKLCSKAFVPQLVKRALPGMEMRHLPVPPSAIPAKLDHQYFSVSKAGPCWDHLVQTRQIGLYVPGEIPEPTIELLAIIDQA